MTKLERKIGPLDDKSNRSCRTKSRPWLWIMPENNLPNEPGEAVHIKKYFPLW